jgi:streptogramin lyase
VPAPAASAQLQFLKQWGGTGSADGRFAGNPFDLATDPGGSVYVADSGNDRVQRFTPEGEFVSKWGSSGGGNGRFTEPSGIHVGPGGSVYVADYVADGRIQMFGSSGAFLTAWRGPSGAVLDFPFGVASDGAGNVYVTDRGNARVQRFSPTGAFISTFGGPGNFDQPLGVTLDRTGNVYVVDGGEENVQKFTAVGDPIATFDFGSSLAGPTGIATDPGGNLYLTDSGNDRVLHFSPSGAVLGQFGGPGPGSGTFSNPTGVATDCRGNVYVIDAGHNAVQKFGDPDDPPPPCVAAPPAGLLVEIKAARKQKLKQIAVKVTCVLEDCTAQAGGSAKVRKKKSKLGGQERELEAGVPTTFELGFPGDNQVKRIRRALRNKKARRKAKVKFVVLARDDQGTVDIERASAKLRR